MCEPFIRNCQYNFIKQQADAVLHALRTVGDPKIVESVRYSAQAKVAELFPEASDSRKAMLEAIADLKTGEDFQKYVQALEPQLLAFPALTEKQLRKLFPKNKKLKLPDLSQTDYRYVSYLSWIDISTNKMFIVYALDGELVGIEGSYTFTHKKSYCFVCNQYKELALFSAITKKRPAHASPDYYKSVGNYICADGRECNRSLTETAPLEKFIRAVLG